MDTVAGGKKGERARHWPKSKWLRWKSVQGADKPQDPFPMADSPAGAMEVSPLAFPFKMELVIQLRRAQLADSLCLQSRQDPPQFFQRSRQPTTEHNGVSSISAQFETSLPSRLCSGAPCGVGWGLFGQIYIAG